MRARIHYFVVKPQDSDAIVYLGGTRARAQKELAQYCRDNWNDCPPQDDDGNDIEDPPDDDQECIDLCFADNEYHYLDTDTSEWVEDVTLEGSTSTPVQSALSDKHTAIPSGEFSATIFSYIVREDGEDAFSFLGGSQKIVNKDLADWCRDNWREAYDEYDEDEDDDPCEMSDSDCIDRFFEGGSEYRLEEDTACQCYGIVFKGSAKSTPSVTSASAPSVAQAVYSPNDAANLLRVMLQSYDQAVSKDSPMSDMAKQVLKGYFHSGPDRVRALLGL